jgi:hypothetical protein
MIGDHQPKRFRVPLRLSAETLRTYPAFPGRAPYHAPFPTAFQGAKSFPNGGFTTATSHPGQAHPFVGGPTRGFPCLPNVIGWTYRFTAASD